MFTHPAIIPVFLACPVCTYDRVMPTWYFFVAIRAVIVLLLTRGRMDAIRLLGAFILFEGAYLYAWRFFVWYSHPAVAEGLVENLSMIGLLVLSAGLPAAVFLWLVSRIRYFRGKSDLMMSFRRCLAIVPMFFALSVVQGL
jgi:hypothetical protein